MPFNLNVGTGLKYIKKTRLWGCYWLSKKNIRYMMGGGGIPGAVFGRFWPFWLKSRFATGMLQKSSHLWGDRRDHAEAVFGMYRAWSKRASA